MSHLPRHSPMLPALRDADALLNRLQARQQALIAAGHATEGVRQWGRIMRVARWQAESESPKKSWPVRRPDARAQALDCLDALIAEINLGGMFDRAA